MSLLAPDSEVDICNLALNQLKQASIVQLEPPTTQVEELCALWYHQVRRARLRSHSWNFAVKRVQITPSSSNTPLFGFTHAYEKPSDFIRFLGRYDDNGLRIGIDSDYEIEGNFILLNGDDSSAINIRYIYDFTHVAKMDPLFVHLFALDLAIVMAPKFSASEARLGSLIKLQGEAEAKATAIDGQERPPRRMQRSKFIDARRGGRTRGGGIAGPYTNF